MGSESTAKLIEAVAKLVGAVAWPLVAAAAVIVLAPSLRRFLSNMSEVRLRGSGFEASAVRHLDLDATSQKLRDFWKPGGRINKTNAAQIAATMRELGIDGSVSWLINAGTREDRERVARRLPINT